MHRIYGLEKDSLYLANVFSVWVEHGKQPKNESYEYIVVPGIDYNGLKKYSTKLPVEIISNTSEIQAVKQHKLQQVGMAFFQAGQLDISENISVKTNSPILLLFDFKSNKLTASEPTGKINVVSISIISNGKKPVVKELNFEELNNNGLGGKSISLDLEDTLKL